MPGWPLIDKLNARIGCTDGCGLDLEELDSGPRYGLKQSVVPTEYTECAK